MTRNDLLFSLKEFTEDVVKDLMLPVRMQKDDAEQPPDRQPEVHLMRLPDPKSVTKKAPYILHEIVETHDKQAQGRLTVSTVRIRSVFCIYHPVDELGGLALNECMERLRIGMLRSRVLGHSRLIMSDQDHGEDHLQTYVYPNDFAPYHLGEMITTWEIPSVEMEVMI